MGGQEIRAIRAARERAARQALRGIEPGDEDDEDGLLQDDHSDDEDVEEAGELGPEDELLAQAPPGVFQESWTPAESLADAAVPVGSNWDQEALASVEAGELDGGAVEAAEPQRERLVPEKLKLLWTTELPEGAEVFCVRNSADDGLIAAGCGDGAVRILHADGGRLAYELSEDTDLLQLPITCLRFRPQGAAGSSTRNMLLSAGSDGTIKHWHMTSKRCLHTITEADNQVYALDYTADGAQFASGGRDCAVRIYDEATKTCVTQLLGNMASYLSFEKQSSGHSNRIFSVKFDPVNPQMLLSAGWDNTVQMWDLREGRSVRSIYGPHICGDALDLRDGRLLTGSWRMKEQLQLWDMESGELMETVPWGPASSPWVTPGQSDPCQLYGAQFHPGGDLVAAAGSGSNELKIFSLASRRPIGSIALPRGVYGLDFAHHGQSVAVATGDCTVRLLGVPGANAAPGDRE